MPLKNCRLDGKPGYKWGNTNKCWTYNPDDAKSKLEAKKQALKQGIAIEGPEKFKKEMASAENVEEITGEEYLSAALANLFEAAQDIKDPSEDMDVPSEEMLLCDKCGDKMEADAEKKQYSCAKCGNKKDM